MPPDSGHATLEWGRLAIDAPMATAWAACPIRQERS